MKFDKQQKESRRVVQVIVRDCVDEGVNTKEDHEREEVIRYRRFQRHSDGKVRAVSTDDDELIDIFEVLRRCFVCMTLGAADNPREALQMMSNICESMMKDCAEQTGGLVIEGLDELKAVVAGGGPEAVKALRAKKVQLADGLTSEQRRKLRSNVGGDPGES